jgi:uncharacterized protein Yka (UPF0111/DUF47 family)
MFHITDTRQEAIALADTLMKSVTSLEQAILLVRKPREVLKFTRQVKLLEEEGDALYHGAVGKLFLNDPEPIEVIKWKELFDTLERAIDACQAVGIVLESISIKNS